MPIDRRSFLQILSASALSANFPESIARALAIPANNRTGAAEGPAVFSDMPYGHISSLLERASDSPH